MEVNAQVVKELREKTNVGFMECKKALQETGGDLTKAIEYLRKQGISVAAKKSGREVKDGVSALDVTMACFPAGTLSGSPKVRAMQIIDRLETYRRGPYGGVVGYFDFAGDADAAITIRSAVIKEGKAYVQAGAGIVADSVPHSENVECQNKALAMITSVRRAAGLRPARADS